LPQRPGRYRSKGKPHSASPAQLQALRGLGALVQRSPYHWQLNLAAGGFAWLVDWWPTTGKWRVEEQGQAADEPTTLATTAFLERVSGTWIGTFPELIAAIKQLTEEE